MYWVAKLYDKLLFKLYSRRIEKYRLGKWLELEEIKQSIQEAVDIRDIRLIADKIVFFISTAIGIGKYNKMPWIDVCILFNEIQDANTVLSLPIMTPSGTNGEKDVWEYPGRSKNMWIHMFAKEFGWSKEVIFDLEIDTAIGLFQEIVVEEQLRKEWEWGLSQNAYRYDEATKTSKYQELPRPTWMRRNLAEEYIKRRKNRRPIPESLMPVGYITDVTH